MISKGLSKSEIQIDKWFPKSLERKKLIMEEKEKGGSNIVVIWC